MKRVAKILSTLLFALVIVCTVIGTVSAKEAAFTDYYGRAALGKMKNGAALQSAYDQIAEGVSKSAKTIRLTKPIHVNQIDVVWDAYTADYAHHFWLGGGFTYSSSGTQVKGISPSYLMSGKKLQKAQKAFEAEVTKILSGVKKDWSELQKEQYIHDALVKRIRYAEASNAHNAYGALVGGVSVCEGYAETFQYLLQRVGIQAFLVSGTGNGEAHEWNYVRIDGKYYHVDLTWDDQEELTYYAYFNLTDKEIKADHAVSAPGFKLPKCNSTKANYFAVNGGKIKSPYNVKTIAKLLKKGKGTVHLYVEDGPEKFAAWINKGNNYGNILKKAGYGTVGARFSSLGKEFIIQLDMTPLEITKQPASVTVAKGKTAKVSLKASGDGLTYTWYYKNAGSSKFKKASATGTKYSVKMSSKVDGQQVYCVIRDRHGNEVKTETVTLALKKTAKITTQPKNVSVKNGKTAKVTVKATGDGLKYTWYYAKKGSSKFKKSSVKTTTYSVKMSSSVNGRRIYCVVKDAYGNTVQSKTVTLKRK